MKIRSLAETCSGLFEEKIAAIRGDEQDGLEDKKQILATQCGRFNLWANDNGKYPRGSCKWKVLIA